MISDVGAMIARSGLFVPGTDIVNVWADGGCAAQNKRSYGSYKLGDFKVVRCAYAWSECRTSNQAEYLTLIRAVEHVVGMTDPAQIALNLHSDSELVVRQLEGRYAVSEPTLVPFWVRLKELLVQFMAVHLVWVPREQMVKLFGH